MTTLASEQRASSTIDASEPQVEADATAAGVERSLIARTSFQDSLEQFRYTRSTSTSRLLPRQPSTQNPRAASRNPLTRSVALDHAVRNRDRSQSGSPAERQRQRQRQRHSSQYAPPSKYAHLAPLTDILQPGLICVFVGFNPGVTTSRSGHAYAHPSNSFWKLLHSSGCTDVKLKPEQDVDLPALYSMGNTNIVARPSKNAAELSKAESAAGTPILEEKIRHFRPEAVCIVGKGIWESIWRWRYHRAIKKQEFRYGWQADQDRLGKSNDWPGAEVFVATATSGLAANLKPHEKEAIWRPFGQWVKERRKERSEAAGCTEGEHKSQLGKQNPLLTSNTGCSSHSLL